MPFGKINSKYRRSINVVYAFIIIWGLFIASSPRVFLKADIYSAVFTTAPIIIILTLSLVFVIASGEIDLSFGSVVGVAGLLFAYVTQWTNNPYLGLMACMLAGVACGLVNGLLITKLRLSSLISTLGMMFLLRGLVMIITEGRGVPMFQVADSNFYKIIVGKVGIFPVQIFWAIGFAVVMWFLFNRFRFGSHVRFIGDNRASAKEMGVNIDRTVLYTFCLVGLAASFAAVLSAMINMNYWPNVGDGYLLIALAAVFLGGTPTWGGVGTIFGAFLGALIISFLEAGIIAAGLTGFYTKFVYGLIIILAIIGHRFGSERRRI
jgi:simple sugar transport system permease protein